MAIRIFLFLFLVKSILSIRKENCHIQGCLSCASPDLCEVCEPSYTLTHDAQNFKSPICIKIACPQNCGTCNANNECLSCKDGFQLTERGACDSTDSSSHPIKRVLQTGCSLANCITCSSAQVCSTCKAGFYVNQRNGQCTECAATVPGCSTCS